MRGRGHHAARRRRRVRDAGRIGEPNRTSVDRLARPARRKTFAALTHRVGQRHQVVFIGMVWQRARMADQLPAARRGDPAGMAHTEIPGMRFPRRSQRADDGR